MHASNVIAAALVAAFLPAAAHASAELAASKACLACHSTDKKLIGPAFKDVAAKYKGSPDGEKQMVRSILEGSSGKWGPIPMPANRVSEAEAGALARWVLSL
ncbi:MULTISPECIES: c-type cytochrome [Cupriavidus]|uniref:c-type cytochrome n=1 Tax=Cupriavidus TaxID=106589 RepID=UPI000362308B|nr:MULTISPECIES: c-type cytochrome [Cupriavidus]